MDSRSSKKKTARKSVSVRIPANRYGIAEWFGKDMTTLSPQERQTLGKLALNQFEAGVSNALETPLCPFLSSLMTGARCNKRGGVCSIRKYKPGPDKTGIVDLAAKVVTLCPNRFVQEVEDGKTLFAWIAEKMLGTPRPDIVKETPFLRRVQKARQPREASRDLNVAQQLEAEEEEEKKAGRIDWIIVKPETLTAEDLEWAAVETQALYFSGKKMPHEFQAYALAPSPILFPIAFRRPDYRSSGPKRLSPQLDVKVPVLGAWGKKVAVVVDQYFFDNMHRLDEVYTRGDERTRLANATVVWFIVDYDENLRLKAKQVHYTNLDSSRKALNATEPLSKPEFTAVLKDVINNPQRSNKVFKASEPTIPE